MAAPPNSANAADNDAQSDYVRIAAIGDLHCTAKSTGMFQPLFHRIAESAEILVVCGDLTDYGLPEEAEVLAGELAVLRSMPIVAVLGNHDYESGQQDQVRQVLERSGVIFLDGDAREIRGIGFAGVKGFGGGFGRATLGSWGERAIKLFVQEAVDEAMRLESALARLRTQKRIAVLHYAPIRATVENEPLEIFPFLGCSRLEEPLNRFAVTAVLHGHAHNGTPEGKTTSGVPVFNVAMPLIRKRYPDGPPFRIIDVAANPESAAARATIAPDRSIGGDSSLDRPPVRVKVG